MGRDTGWKSFLSDDERYADVINGIGCKGEQVVKKEDLQEMDTQTGFLRRPRFVHKLAQFRIGNVKIRDCVRKVAFGTNFAVIGIENEYSCAMKSHFRKSGNQMSGKWKSSYASLLA